MRSFWLVVAFTLLLAIALFRPHPAASASANAGPDALRNLEAEFMKAAAEHGSQGYLSYYADEAVELPNGGPIIQGKINIAKGMGFLDQKDNHLTWAPTGADMSASGDLGYTGITNSAQSIKVESPSSSRASTLRSGKSRRTEVGRSFSTWETAARGIRRSF